MTSTENQQNTPTPTQGSNLEQIGGKATAEPCLVVIHTFSRAQAIEAGDLVDFTDPESDTAEVCRQHYKYPIACTRAAFSIMQRAVENPRYCADYVGILHDMLWMSRRSRPVDASTVLFQVIIQGAGRRKYHTFKLQVGPGDQAEPVITIMLPDED